MTDTAPPAKKPPPLSPHLQIYKPQLASSVLSIFHRATGIALSLGALFLVVWLAAAATGPEAYEYMMGYYSCLAGRIILAGFTWALFYHLCAGLRHLAFDMGYGFSLPAAHRSAWLVVIASLALTALLWVYVGGHLS
jgi:succinate dehydrogenase / fumarate reductase cytochrome b subunit